jgi:hypothetical protein
MRESLTHEPLQKTGKVKIGKKWWTFYWEEDLVHSLVSFGNHYLFLKILSHQNNTTTMPYTSSISAFIVFRFTLTTPSFYLCWFFFFFLFFILILFSFFVVGGGEEECE